MIQHVRHTVNSKFYGFWHFWPDGKGIYLAYRKPSEIYRKKNAWCLDIRTLEEAEKRGVKYVGVVCGHGKNKRVYATLRQDFFNSPYSFFHFGDARQRGLPLEKFRYSTTKTEKHIAATIKLR